MMFQYQQGESWFHHVNPLPKFVWLICISLLAIRYEHTVAQVFLFAYTLLFGSIACRASLVRVWKMLYVPFLFSLPYFLLQLLFIPGETELFRLSGIVVTSEAMDYAAAITIRLLTFILSTHWFILTTDPRDVVLAAVHQLRIPYRFAFALSISLRFLPILRAEAELTKHAHRRRGVPKGIRQQMVWWRSYIFSVFIGAVRRVQQMAEAMEVRGFGRYKERTYRRSLKHTPSGLILSLGSICITAIVFILSLSG